MEGLRRYASVLGKLTRVLVLLHSQIRRLLALL